MRDYCKDREDPITPRMVLDYETAMGKLLLPWQRDIILSVDAEFRKVLSAEIAYNEKRRIDREARIRKR